MSTNAIYSPNLEALRKAEANLRESTIKFEENRRAVRDTQRQKEQAEQHLEDVKSDLVIAEMEKRNLTWCTACGVMINKSDTVLILTEGVRVESGGYQNDSWGCVPSAKVYRACTKCLQDYTDKHGQTGKTDLMNGLTEHFYAFKITPHADGYYARKFGKNVKISGELVPSTRPSANVIEKLASQWQIC